MVKTLAEIGPSKLQEAEQERIRDAADSLIFCGELGDDEGAQAALRDVDGLCEALVASGRWTAPTAQALLGDIAGCGPLEPVPVELQAA